MHDRYKVFDQQPGDKPFKRLWLGDIPKWDRIAGWRYGKARRRHVTPRHPLARSSHASPASSSSMVPLAK